MSLGGSMSSRLPRLFLEFQIARVMRAKGQRAAGDATVDRMLERLVRAAQAEGEDQALIDELRDMAIPERSQELRI